MLYADILKSAEKHMTKKYDTAFAVAKKRGLRWYPWVGKSFRQTGILIIGMITNDRDEGWRATAENDPHTSRGLVAWMDKDDGVPFDYQPTSGGKGDNSKSFKQFSQAFAGDACGDDALKSRAALWELVAFNNFVQRVVETGTQPNKFKSNDVKRARDALSATIDIIKPRLVLVWSVGVVDRMGIGADTLRELLGSGKGARARVFKGDDAFPPTVGIQHPCRWNPINHPEWLNLLHNEPASKEPVKALLKHLSQ